MKNEKIEIMLKKLNCSIYKLNKENGIRFIIVNNDDIQIEQ
ncbi:MAG: hypothetical protein U9R39_07060 [Campylobacterota bacterium]|nr:hypothetical protein [Campylobacterota bacterium]